jgi:hypothetical protein
MEYRCFHCHKVFTEESGLAQEHFGEHTTDLPLCIKYARTGQGGGPHDPYVRVKRSELAKAEADLILVRQLIGGWQNTCSPEEWGDFDQEAVLGAARIHALLIELIS